MVRVNVLYFGVLRESFGGESDTVVLSEGATVADLVTRVKGSRVGGVWGTLAVAVNREYAGLGTALREGDEVALLPPVSGGSVGEAHPLETRAETAQVGR